MSTMQLVSRFYSGSDKILFREQMKRLLQNGVVKQESSSEKGYVFSMSLRKKEG